MSVYVCMYKCKPPNRSYSLSIHIDNNIFMYLNHLSIRILLIFILMGKYVQKYYWH